MRELEPISAYQIILPSTPRIVIEQLVAAQTKSQIEFKTTEELLRHIKYNISNIKHPDGRINLGLDEHGREIANSVSPYSRIFEEQLEDGIKEVVLALTSKRYLTYSSCEGHDIWGRRFVGLAFNSVEEREKFCSFFEKFKKYGVEFQCNDSPSNIESSVLNGKIKYNKLLPCEAKEKDEKQKELEVMTFNCQFRRNYQEYFFVDLVILDFFKQGFWQSFYNIYLWLLKKYFWKNITFKILQKIQDKSFPNYKF